MVKCETCAKFVFDYWSFNYFLFYKHHAHCPNNDSKVDLKEFKQILTNILTQHDERKKKEVWLKENLRK